MDSASFQASRDITRHNMQAGGAVVTEMSEDGRRVLPPPPALLPLPDLDNCSTRNDRRASGMDHSAAGDNVYAAAYGYDDTEYSGRSRKRPRSQVREHELSDQDMSGSESDWTEDDDEDMIVDPVGAGLDNLDDGIMEVQQGINALAVQQVMTPQRASAPPPFRLGATQPPSATVSAPPAPTGLSVGPSPVSLVAGGASVAASPGQQPTMPSPAGDIPVHPALQHHVRAAKEKVAPAVEPSLAAHVTALYDAANLEPVTLKLNELYDKHLRPENLPVLAKTEVNPEIAGGLPWAVIKKDGLARSAQHATVRASSAVLEVVNQLMDIHGIFKREDMPPDVQVNYAGLPQKLVDALIEAVTFLGYAGNRVNTLRRNIIRPHLQFSFRFLCDRALASYELLLGSDLEEVVRRTSDQRKTSSQVVMRPKRHRSKKGRGKQGQGRRSSHFLGEFDHSNFHVLIDDFAISKMQFVNQQADCDCDVCNVLLSDSMVKVETHNVQSGFCSDCLDQKCNVHAVHCDNFDEFMLPDETLYVRNSHCQNGSQTQSFLNHRPRVVADPPGGRPSGAQRVLWDDWHVPDETHPSRNKHGGPNGSSFFPHQGKKGRGGRL